MVIVVIKFITQYNKVKDKFEEYYLYIKYMQSMTSRKESFAMRVSVISPNAIQILVFSRGYVFESCLVEAGDSSVGHVFVYIKHLQSMTSQKEPSREELVG